MKRLRLIAWSIVYMLIVAPCGFAQEDEATPTPTPVPFASSCLGGGVDPQSLLINGDFETMAETGTAPMAWEAGASGDGGILRAQTIPGSDVLNHFVELRPGSSITQTPIQDRIHTRFKIRFCAVVQGGQVEVFIGGSRINAYPNVVGDGAVSGEFISREIPLNLGTSTGVSSNKVEIRYQGAGVAYLDNVQLLPVVGDGQEDEMTPTPTPPPATPTPVVTPGPTATPTPTIPPGTATPTPTAKLTAESVQITANPPMLLVSPDDFAKGGGPTQQSLIDFELIGADGESIDLSKYEDVRVRITTDRGGNVHQYENNNFQRLSDWEDYEDLRDVPIYYFPTTTYDGTVRVIIDVEFQVPDGNTREIRGVLKFIQRLDKKASLIGQTGSFNPARNYASGRQPGDRGFRPDQRANLYFRERLD